jgi:hypothetical protein
VITFGREQTDEVVNDLPVSNPGMVCRNFSLKATSFNLKVITMEYFLVVEIFFSGRLMELLSLCRRVSVPLTVRKNYYYY